MQHERSPLAPTGAPRIAVSMPITVGGCRQSQPFVLAKVLQLDKVSETSRTLNCSKARRRRLKKAKGVRQMQGLFHDCFHQENIVTGYLKQSVKKDRSPTNQGFGLPSTCLLSLPSARLAVECRLTYSVAVLSDFKWISDGKTAMI